jgi:PAS domain S-box-containing protein
MAQALKGEMMKKALLVDNDYFFVEFLGDLLEQRGYQILKAANGKEGIARLEKGPVDILFADLVLPKVDSRQLFSFVRHKFNGACFPIVALSGTTIEQLGTLEDIGADFYIAKGPIDKLENQLNEFMTRIERKPLPPNGGMEVLSTGGVFPRRDAVELLNSLKFQKAILADMGVGVLVVDKDARIIDANTLALEITARSSFDLLNNPVVDIFPNESRTLLSEALKDAVKDPEIRVPTLPAVFSERLIETRVSTIRQDGEPAGWTVVLVP